ncbi:MAG: lipopolysaccharide heptosyltransferase II [Pyrinomonadaceae bacterium]|nr:lipopolysaccharide heptosyltransferase II [Pyrinomonadaceae bacterium]
MIAGFSFTVRERRLQAEKIKRIVVRGTNWVGDAVMTVPALRALRQLLPQAHITLATRPWAEGLFADADFIDDLLLYERGRRDVRAVVRQTREWRNRRFDLAVLFQNAFEAALIAAAARVPLRLGYATDGRRALLTHPLPLPAWRSERHEVFYYLNIVGELERLLYGTSNIEQQTPSYALHVSAERREQARFLLKEHGATETRPLVALCPGSTNSRAKRWPAERFAALADMLITEEGMDVALVGSPAELEVSLEVSAAMKVRPIMLTGKTNLAQAVAVLSLSNALVTNDTGPAHIAAALERPTIVIFGPTDPRTTRPFSQTAEIIRRPPECAPCMLRDCPIDHRCMTAITPAEVFTRVCALIRREAAAEVRV